MKFENYNSLLITIAITIIIIIIKHKNTKYTNWCHFLRKQFEWIKELLLHNGCCLDFRGLSLFELKEKKLLNLKISVVKCEMLTFTMILAVHLKKTARSYVQFCKIIKLLKIFKILLIQKLVMRDCMFLIYALYCICCMSRIPDDKTIVNNFNMHKY